MTKTRFAPWLVFACIGTLVGCTSGDQGTAGNTELNVVIPTGSSQSGPAAYDIESVEYTINCVGADFDPTTDPDIDSGDILNQNVQINGSLEVLDTASSGVTTQDFGPDLTEVYVWQGFMDIPANHSCTVQLRARDGDGEVICTSTEGFTVGADATVKVNVLMICDISYQAPVGMLDLDGDFSFNIGNYCPDLFVLNCVDPDLEELPGPAEEGRVPVQDQTLHHALARPGQGDDETRLAGSKLFQDVQGVGGGRRIVDGGPGGNHIERIDGIADRLGHLATR